MSFIFDSHLAMRVAFADGPALLVFSVSRAATFAKTNETTGTPDT